MRIEVRSLKDVFSESLGDEEISALVPLSSIMTLSEDGRWSLVTLSSSPSSGSTLSGSGSGSGGSSFYPSSSSSSSPPYGYLSNQGNLLEEITKQKISNFSPPFSLAVKSDKLAQCLFSISASGGFPGVLFRVLMNRYGEGASGIPKNWRGLSSESSKWTIFVDRNPTGALEMLLGKPRTTFRFTERDLLLAEEAFSRRKEFVYSHLDQALRHTTLSFSGPEVSAPDVGYYSGIFLFLSQNAPGVLAVSDYHPFYFNGLGEVKRRFNRGLLGENRMLVNPNILTRGRLPLLLAYLDFSENIHLEDPLDLKILEDGDLDLVGRSLLEEKLRELEEVWSIGLGEDSPIGAERARVLGIQTSNTYYWTSLMETFGKLYIIPKEKELKVEYELEEEENWPELDFLSEEERRGLVMGYKTASSFKGLRWSNTHPIYFSPTLIFDYPNNLGNIKTIYLIPLTFIQGTISNYFFFFPVIAFSGRLGISTLFSGNKELAFDFLLVHSYPVREGANIPYMSISSVMGAEIGEPRVGGLTLSSHLKEKGIELVRSKEKLFSGSTIYLRKGIIPIPGVRFSTLYLPLLLKETEGEEKFDAGNLDNLSDSLRINEVLLKAPAQERLFPEYVGKEVYLVNMPFYNGEEDKFRKRISDMISSSAHIVKKKKQYSGRTCVEAYILREDLRQEALSFPVIVCEERARALLSHQYYSYFKHLVGFDSEKGEEGEGEIENQTNRVNRKSPAMEELKGYMSFLPKEAREEAKSYLSYLSRLLRGCGPVLKDIPPPPQGGLSVFALISEPAFHLIFSPWVQTSPSTSTPGGSNIREVEMSPLGFVIDAYPYWNVGRPAASRSSQSEFKERYLPSSPMVRFLRINYYQGPKEPEEPGTFVLLFTFHHGEAFGVQEGYPLNTVLPLIL